MSPPIQALIAAILLAGLASAAQAADSRVEIPIVQRTLSDGTLRYAVLMTIGGATIEAGLDTGSTGLRLRPGAAPVATTRRREIYAYSGGVKLDSVPAEAEVGIGGGLSGRIGVHVATRVGCTIQRPRCSASTLPPGQFGLMGDGLDGEGFEAVLGLGMAGKPTDNPLRALGARRWIVILPRPGEPEPGKLVVNPFDAEVRDFVLLPLLARTSWRDDSVHDAVEGCLKDVAATVTICGPVTLDTGANRIVLMNAAVGVASWTGPAILSFTGAPAGVAFSTSQTGPAAKIVSGRDPNLPRSTILAGVTPYFADDVLYDPAQNRMGLRARRPWRDSP
jgi:hypothetical protein